MSLQDDLLTAKVAAFTWAATTWNKIKDYLLAAFALATLILLGYEKYQASKVAKLQDQLSLLTTQKQAEDLQLKINAEIQDAQSNGQNADALVALAQQLAAKSASLQPTNQTNQSLSDSLNEELK